ncbi:hypothetical protein CRG98_037434 [Punica granatum]|uniref:Uncharacterized protein n=1 Tax=Punica granatum TaxID=22663 RepID=A0A2I0IDX1_PUNGR|nr:hypothetical protein CRG98_037434 [Punica granatum]
MNKLTTSTTQFKATCKDFAVEKLKERKRMRMRLLARKGKEAATKIAEERRWRRPRKEESGGPLEELGRQRREGGGGGGGGGRRTHC